MSPSGRERTTSNPGPVAPQHLFLDFRHPTKWRLVLAGLLLVSLLVGLGCTAARAAAQKKTKEEEFAGQCLLFGTVFTQQGLSLPGAEIKVRRVSEKKFRWEGNSDRRGEFAVRVPMGEDYEIAIKAKGYAPLTRTVDAKSTNRVDLVFRLQPAAGGKKK